VTIFKGFSDLKWNFLQFYAAIFVRFLCFAQTIQLLSDR
jgi:hypothetical protein